MGIWKRTGSLPPGVHSVGGEGISSPCPVRIGCAVKIQIDQRQRLVERQLQPDRHIAEHRALPLSVTSRTDVDRPARQRRHLKDVIGGRQADIRRSAA